MTETAPLRRIPDPARAAIRALLLAELTAAHRRVEAAGCPPEVLTRVFEARRSWLTELGRTAPPKSA
ncbi:hypothetical protein MUY14_04175 [Amycolatopsis sp. FBCC-B4732]|uniref:hypothetical protein n=1 Tax=Amycolatopsis sp. FBCC-B4732 TaxID=3079339 RepID=UPI001FF3C15A|nr:hypothetical protein [Amycolatopsis sp. FBCC-B4732]UOX89844.1 hypothetical protein MUY14_04175 [Amycolatopsis sp. FBCC-B4732]